MSPTTPGRWGRVCKELGMQGTVECPEYTVTRARSQAASLCPQEGVTSQTSHWSRLYFMTFYIVTMVSPRPRSPPFNTQSLPVPLPGGRPPRGGEAGMGGQHLTGSAACAAAHAPALPLCARPGGDDHHCRLHPRGLCLPHELQPQEPGLGRSVQAAVAGAFLRLVWAAAQLSAVWLSSAAVWLSRLLAVQRICLVYLLHLSVH